MQKLFLLIFILTVITGCSCAEHKQQIIDVCIEKGGIPDVSVVGCNLVECKLLNN
jgi:hypothetical protein